MTVPVQSDDSTRRLNPHKTARLRDELPSAELLARHVIVSHVPGGHWFWSERKGTRSHDHDGQATIRWRDRWYNVTRVLLQHRLDARIVRAVNACGLPQCVRPEHWTVHPSFLGPVARGAGLATVRVGGAWRLSSHGVLVKRDMAFVAKVKPGACSTLHIVRALHDESETVFLTACGIEVDPGLVVAGGEPTCEECLR